jgi:hypothetical protein
MQLDVLSPHLARHRQPPRNRGVEVPAADEGLTIDHFIACLDRGSTEAFLWLLQWLLQYTMQINLLRLAYTVNDCKPLPLTGASMYTSKNTVRPKTRDTMRCALPSAPASTAAQGWHFPPPTTSLVWQLKHSSIDVRQYGGSSCHHLAVKTRFN